MQVSLFSIITVCLNSEKTLEKTLASVLSQTCDDYEYLVIDGGSTDSSLDIIKRYEPLLKGKMKWVSEKDTGIYNAMNKGAKLSSGHYLLFLNTDDFYEPEMLENIRERIKCKPEADIYYGDTRFLSETESNVCVSRTDMLFCAMSVSHISMAVSRDCFMKNGCFNESYKIAADWDFTLHAWLTGATFEKYPGCFSNFYTGGISADKDSYVGELENISRKHLHESLNLDYRSIYGLFSLPGLSIDEQKKELNRLQSGPINEIKLRFLSAYAEFILYEYQTKVNRYENSKIWKLQKAIKRLLVKVRR